MQIETRYGEFSVTCLRDAGRLRPDTLLIHATSRHALDALRRAYPKIAWIAVEEAEGGTYRIPLPKAVWSRIVEDMVRDIDYASFVPEETHRMPRGWRMHPARAA